MKLLLWERLPAATIPALALAVASQSHLEGAPTMAHYRSSLSGDLHGAAKRDPAPTFLGLPETPDAKLETRNSLS